MPCRRTVTHFNDLLLCVGRHQDWMSTATEVTHLAEPPDLATFSPGSPVLRVLVAI